MENQNPNWRQKVLTAVDDPAEGGHGRRRGGGEGPNCNGYKGGDEGEEAGDDEREQKGETAIRQIMEGARFVGASGLGRIHGKARAITRNPWRNPIPLCNCRAPEGISGVRN